MNASGNETCYGDVCMAGSFCDHLSKFCFKCDKWLHTCFTDNHIPRCTRVCKEKIDHLGMQSTTMLEPRVELNSEHSTPWLTILLVVAAIVCLISAIFIIVCLYKKLGICRVNKPTKVLGHTICRIFHMVYKQNNSQTSVKQTACLEYTSNSGTSNDEQADTSRFDQLSLTSLLYEEESQSFRNFCPTTDAFQTPHENVPRPNTDNISRDHRDYYQIPKPIKEVGDGGRSVHVDGHVLKPREKYSGHTLV